MAQKNIQKNTQSKGKTLSEFIGQKLVLFFYPKDNTPGCTTEAIEFSERRKQFESLGYTLLGVSRDSEASHLKFKDKHNLKVELLSDQDEVLCQKFSVIKEKNMYGKKVMGIERSTFLIDEKGAVIEEFRKIKAQGHAQEILDYIRGRKEQ